MEKNLFWLSCNLVLMIVLTFTSCSEDPSKNKVFIGTYDGLVTYGRLDGGLDVRTNKKGTVTVTKIGNSYTFTFSDDIPAIKDIKMEKSDENTNTYKGKGLNKITITKNKLYIFFNHKGNSWTAICSREIEEK